jgi:microsomal dipeptidase-like Zn-dependent dipeptidase
MHRGKVIFQNLAIFTFTREDSLHVGERQLELFLRLLYRNNFKNRECDKETPRNFCSERASLTEKQEASENENSQAKLMLSPTDPSDYFGVGHYSNQFQSNLELSSSHINIFPSIENSSAFSSEEEPLRKSLDRLEHWLKRLPCLLSLSLTWNSENRFGGGSSTQIGLKEDGKELLRFLSGRNIAIDFSHTSDWLAADILDLMDREDLQLKPVATHSNFRAIQDHPRNLPDELAKAIFARGGVIGMNFVRAFIGAKAEDCVKHILHAKTLGGLQHLCLGADFFCDSDSDGSFSLPPPLFFSDLADASCYPRYFEYLAPYLNSKELENLAHGALLSFVKANILHRNNLKNREYAKETPEI